MDDCWYQFSHQFHSNERISALAMLHSIGDYIAAQVIHENRSRQK